MADQELQLKVTLVDQASPQLKQLRDVMKQLGQEAGTHSAKAGKEVKELGKQIEELTKHIGKLGAELASGKVGGAFEGIAGSVVGVTRALGPMGAALGIGAAAAIAAAKIFDELNDRLAEFANKINSFNTLGGGIGIRGGVIDSITDQLKTMGISADRGAQAFSSFIQTVSRANRVGTPEWLNIGTFQNPQVMRRNIEEYNRLIAGGHEAQAFELAARNITQRFNEARRSGLSAPNAILRAEDVGRAYGIPVDVARRIAERAAEGKGLHDVSEEEARRFEAQTKAANDVISSQAKLAQAIEELNRTINVWLTGPMTTVTEKLTDIMRWLGGSGGGEHKAPGDSFNDRWGGMPTKFGEFGSFSSRLDPNLVGEVEDRRSDHQDALQENTDQLKRLNDFLGAPGMGGTGPGGGALGLLGGGLGGGGGGGGGGGLPGTPSGPGNIRTSDLGSTTVANTAWPGEAGDKGYFGGGGDGGGGGVGGGGSAARGAAIYQKLLTAFRGSKLVGVVPPDGARFGITTGSAEEWARFGTAVAHAESSFNPRDTAAHERSFGIFQYDHSQVPGGNAYSVDASIKAFVRDAERSAGGLRGGILGRRFSTIGAHPGRTSRHLAEAERLGTRGGGGGMSAAEYGAKFGRVFADQGVLAQPGQDAFSPEAQMTAHHLGGGGSSGGAVGQRPIGTVAALALAKQHLGDDEIRDRSKLSSFFAGQGIRIDPSQTAWCAAFVNAELHEAGVKGTGSLAAASFYKWGHPATGGVQPGDIGVLPHHVGFLTGRTRMQGGQEYVEMLGGNQGGTVSGRGGVSLSWRRLSSLSVRRGDMDIDRSALDRASGPVTAKIDGGADINVNVAAPPGTSVSAKRRGIFRKQTVSRQTQMQPAQTGPSMAEETVP